MSIQDNMRYVDMPTNYWLHSDYLENCGGGVSQKWMGSYIYN